jgi:hypothetical protein
MLEQAAHAKDVTIFNRSRKMNNAANQSSEQKLRKPYRRGRNTCTHVLILDPYST